MGVYLHSATRIYISTSGTSGDKADLLTSTSATRNEALFKISSQLLPSRPSLLPQAMSSAAPGPSAAAAAAAAAKWFLH